MLKLFKKSIVHCCGFLLVSFIHIVIIYRIKTSCRGTTAMSLRHVTVTWHHPWRCDQFTASPSVYSARGWALVSSWVSFSIYLFQEAYGSTLVYQLLVQLVDGVVCAVHPSYFCIQLGSADSLYFDAFVALLSMWHLVPVWPYLMPWWTMLV